MRFTSVAVVFAAAASVAAQTALTIQTPVNVAQCQPVLLNFSGGSPPYIIEVVPQGQEAATPLVTFPTTSANSLTWNVALAANTLISLTIRDATGAIQASGPITVSAGTGDASCLTGSASQGSTAAIGSTAPVAASSAATTPVAGATTAAVATSAAPGATTAAAGTTTAAAGTTKPAAAATTSAAAAAATTKSGASKIQPIGIAGLLALVGFAALL
ncbi:hypothetical protein FRB97_002195 [Tulasnella sp. 331]|nr:hypothetical protein FRB97_002195 [Tulasnella sp. 331]